MSALNRLRNRGNAEKGRGLAHIVKNFASASSRFWIKHGHPLPLPRSPTSESIHDLNNGTARPIFMNLYAQPLQGDQIDHGTEGQQGTRLGWRNEV